MASEFLVHFSFTAAPTAVAVVLAVTALVCGGWAFYTALHSVESPRWVRADAAIIAVALYAFAFGRLHTIDAQSAMQVLAYAIGFLGATLLEPLHSRLSARQERERGE